MSRFKNKTDRDLIAAVLLGAVSFSLGYFYGTFLINAGWLFMCIYAVIVCSGTVSYMVATRRDNTIHSPRIEMQRAISKGFIS